MRSYILPKVLKNTLINVNLSEIYAEYCESISDPDFTLKYRIEHKDYDEAVRLLEMPSVQENFIAYALQLVIHRPHAIILKIKSKL